MENLQIVLRCLMMTVGVKFRRLSEVNARLVRTISSRKA